MKLNQKHFPISEELVAGELSVTIRLHEVEHGAIPCWMYVTEGLASYKQREIAFTLVRRPAERLKDYPREPLAFFRTLLKHSKEGRIVDAGAFSTFGGAKVVGFPGMAFFEPGARDVGLAMVGLTGEEVEVVQEFGVQRVLSLMGGAARFHPAPYWTDRDRPSRTRMADLEQSVLSKVSRISQTGFSVCRVGGRLVLRAREGRASDATRDALRELAIDQAVALLTELDPSADGQLRWEPGQREAHASITPGSKAERLGGSFVMFLPEQGSDGQELVEDGYLLSLTKESWARLREAILAQESLVTPVCELGWTWAGLQETLPSDAKAKTWPVGESCRKSRMLLKQSVERTAKSANMESLAGFVTAIELAVREVFRTRSAQGGVRVDVSLEPRNLTFQIARTGEVDDEAMRQVWLELQMLGGLAVTEKVGLAVEFEIEKRKSVASGK